MNVLKSIEKGFIKCNMQQPKNNNTFTLIFVFFYALIMKTTNRKDHLKKRILFMWKIEEKNTKKFILYLNFEFRTF